MLEKYDNSVGLLTCEEVEVCESAPLGKLGKLGSLVKILKHEIEAREVEISIILTLIENAKATLEMEQIQEIDHYLDKNYISITRNGFNGKGKQIGPKEVINFKKEENKEDEKKF